MANGYSAGDLNLSIQTISNDTIKSLDAVIERLSLIDKSLGGIKVNSYIRKTATKTPKQSSSLFGFAKLGASAYMLRRMGRFAANLVQAGSDYNETLNLWQVAMRGNLDVADQFVNKMQKAYGISSKTLMNAQAIFKNMIGSLGQISDQTAYKLSEALVQMSADFSSLYNVQLESAFEKMQSMLAGQVRPIRSAGLDMTETTLFMFYQQLGGTKTMRQLNRTEKQLLSILAVYQQMGSAGALGDMTKTLNQFANQSRMMTEYWAELKTWSGLLLKDLIDQSGLLIKINAFLITTTEIIKAIAKSRGLGDENYLTGLFETTNATNDAVDELQGKLLDFDKFRSLEGQSASPLAIDEKLLQAITGYSSKIDQAQNEAEKLAKEWLKILGFTDENNDGIVDITANAKDFLASVKSIATSLAVIATLKPFLQLATAITTASHAMSLFKTVTNAALYGGVFLLVYYLSKLIILGDELTTGTKVLYTAFSILGMTLLAWSLYSKYAAKSTTLLTDALAVQRIAAILLAIGGLGLLIGYIWKLSESWNEMKTWEKVVGIFGAIGAAALAAAAAVAAFHGSWTLGTGVVAIVGALAAITAAFVSFKSNTKDLSVPMFASGASDIDGGTLFVAGEMGKTEAVYSGSNGKTNVANVRQMEQAFYNALARHSAEGNGTIVVQAYLDGEKVYENTTAKAKARGKVWAKA